MMFIRSIKEFNFPNECTPSGTAVVNPGRDIHTGYYYGTRWESTISKVAQGSIKSPVLGNLFPANHALFVNKF